MQRRLIARISALAIATAAVVAVGCSNDTSGVNPGDPAASKTGANSSGSDSTPTPQTPPTPATVASVQVTPHSGMLPLTYTLTFAAAAFDAHGTYIPGKTAKFTSSDPSILAQGIVLADSANFIAKALGTAKVYATIDGHTDSATIVVVNSLPAAPAPSAVDKFMASVHVAVPAPGSGTDTSASAPLAGARVVLHRVGTTSGDSLSTPEDAGSATTDAHGGVVFQTLVGGTYRVDITPPDGSPYLPMQTGFAPPRTPTVNLAVVLQKKS
jgi:hypothetical protein